MYQVLTFGNDIVYKTHLHPEKDEVFQMWNLQTGIKSVYKFSCKAQKQYWLTIKEVHIKIHKETLMHVLWQRFNDCVVQFHKFQQNSQVYRMLQVLWFVLVDFPGKTQFLHCREIKKTDYRYDSMFLLSVV